MEKMILSHIVAVSRNYVIGKDNRLPWHMPDDMRYFHRITRGHIVIMGRKNYEANGGALKGRSNIVITRNKGYTLPDAEVVHSVDEAIQLAASRTDDEVFIVGGGNIYAQTLATVDRIYITVIDTEVKGDAHYPRIDFDDYRIVSREPHSADKSNPFDWTYYILEK